MSRKPPPAGPGGLILVDKDAGMTSHDVVSRVRRIAGTRRVGHAGTLDPMATGVLVLGVERATKLLHHLVLTDKAYCGQFAQHVQALGWQHHVASRPPTATRGFVPVAQRWVVERTFAWLNYFRRLAMDYERTTASHAAWLLVANLTMTLCRATAD